MMTSGLVLTLTADVGLAEHALALLRTRPEITVGSRMEHWLPMVVEVEDVRAARDLHEWLLALPGVAFVDVAQVNFEDETRAVGALGGVGEDCHPLPGFANYERGLSESQSEIDPEPISCDSEDSGATDDRKQNDLGSL